MQLATADSFPTFLGVLHKQFVPGSLVPSCQRRPGGFRLVWYICCEQEFRQRLPSWKAQDELLQMIKSSQVTVISGETGCGKTTQVRERLLLSVLCDCMLCDCYCVQVPQFILDDAIMSGWGSRCHVICTQPRRISALSGYFKHYSYLCRSLLHSCIACPIL